MVNRTVTPGQSTTVGASTRYPAVPGTSDLVPGGRRRRRASGLSRLMLVAVFALPALALMLTFLVYPTIQSVQFSLYDWNGIGTATWTGLANYRALFTDDLFRTVLGNSLILASVGTVGSMAVGLLWAYAVERRIPGWRAYRFLLFIPVVMPATISALMWAVLLDTFGPVGDAFRTVGLTAPAWLGDPHVALWVIVFVAVWQTSGFTMLITLGAMEDVPAELHDAASLDGANSLRRLVSIVVPYIRGTLGTLVVIQFIGLLKAFDIVFATTRGGPGYSTDVLGVYLYQKAFRESQYGYGSAVAVAMTLIMFTLSFVFYKRLLGKDATT